MVIRASSIKTTGSTKQQRTKKLPVNRQYYDDCIHIPVFDWTLRQSQTFDGGKTVSDAGATTVSVGSRFGEQDLPHFFEAKKWGSSQRPFS